MTDLFLHALGRAATIRAALARISVLGLDFALEKFMLRYGVMTGLLVGALAACGCAGKSKAEVSGKVSYKNEPLGAGTVTLVYADGNRAWSEIGADGSYAIKDAKPGKATICVETSDPKTAMQASDSLDPNAKSAPAASAGKYVKIPDKYKNEGTSGLSMDVVSGKQQKDINLE